MRSYHDRPRSASYRQLSPVALLKSGTWLIIDHHWIAGAVRDGLTPREIDAINHSAAYNGVEPAEAVALALAAVPDPGAPLVLRQEPFDYRRAPGNMAHYRLVSGAPNQLAQWLEQRGFDDVPHPHLVCVRAKLDGQIASIRIDDRREVLLIGGERAVQAAIALLNELEAER